MPEPSYCLRCGSVAWSRLRFSGSIWIEVLLWLAFLVPGLIYSLWRQSTKRWVCRVCGAVEVMPVSSPRAQVELAAKQIPSPQPDPFALVPLPHPEGRRWTFLPWLVVILLLLLVAWGMLGESAFR